MRILHFIYDYIENPWVGGGGAVRAFELNRRLVKKGHRITMVCGKFPGASDGFLEGIELKFLGIPAGYKVSVLSYAPSAFLYLLRHYRDYDIIIEDFAPWNPIFSFLFQKRRRVILQTFHKEGKEILSKYGALGIPFYLIERFYPKLFERSISISEESAKKFGIESEIIPCGITQVHGYRGLGDYILFLGRINIHNKGLDTLLEALKGSSLKLKIAGRGRDTNELMKLIREKGLKENVEYLGFVDEEKKRELIKGCRFLVLPSRYEGQGIVILEAASFGKPVLVSDLPELRYAVNEGFGVSFRRNDPEDLRKKLESMWRNTEDLKRMSVKALEYANKLTWGKLADRYESFLLSQLQT